MSYGVKRIEFYIDGIKVQSMTAPPSPTRWRMEIAGEYELCAGVYGLAADAIGGNPVTLNSIDTEASGRFSENHTAPHHTAPHE